MAVLAVSSIHTSWKATLTLPTPTHQKDKPYCSMWPNNRRLISYKEAINRDNGGGPQNKLYFKLILPCNSAHRNRLYLKIILCCGYGDILDASCLCSSRDFEPDALTMTRSEKCMNLLFSD